MHPGAVFLSFALLASVSARSVPPNVRSFFERVRSNAKLCTGPAKLASGFFATDDRPPQFSYCLEPTANVIYLRGPGKALADMDIDCDGDQSFRGDGRCGKSRDTQSQTSFKSDVKKFGIPDLNANIHPFVVFGNEGNFSPTFNPRKFGIKPLSVMAVVCGDKLVYGVWGDTNGDDGRPIIGEASLSLATACFGKRVNGNNGHTDLDVLYVAFPGDEAVPGKKANWKARNFEDFEKSIAELGDKLVKRLS